MARYLLWLALLFSVPALAHLRNENATTEDNKWADRQTNIYKVGCCGMGDAHFVDEDHMRMVNGTFEIEITDTWLPIGPHMMLDRALEDPNPTSRAVVWYGVDTTMPGGVRIYCFAPPSLI